MSRVRLRFPGQESVHSIEPVLYLLTLIVVFFTALLFVASYTLPNDGQTFQVISGLLTGFAGALLGRVKPADTKKSDVTMDAPGNSTTTTLETRLEPPAEPGPPAA